MVNFIRFSISTLSQDGHLDCILCPINVITY